MILFLIFALGSQILAVGCDEGLSEWNVGYNQSPFECSKMRNYIITHDISTINKHKTHGEVKKDQFHESSSTRQPQDYWSISWKRSNDTTYEDPTYTESNEKNFSGYAEGKWTCDGRWMGSRGSDDSGGGSSFDSSLNDILKCLEQVIEMIRIFLHLSPILHVWFCNSWIQLWCSIFIMRKRKICSGTKIFMKKKDF